MIRDNSFSRDKIITNNLVNASYSKMDDMNDNSFQQANSDLFLESHNNDKYIFNELYRPQILESELLD